MSKWKILGLLILVVSLMALYNWFSFKNLKAKPRAYVYDDFMGPKNGALIIQDLMYKDSIIKYYRWAEKNKDYQPFNFPLKTLPTNDPVYITNYTDDSLLVEVVSLFERGKHFGGGYTKGYIYIGTLHPIN